MPTAAIHVPLLTGLAVAAAALLRRRAVGGDDIERVTATVVEGPASPGAAQAMVQSYAYVGCTDREIADRLGVDERAVGQSYRADLLLGRARRAFAIRRAQTELAITKENGPMLTWLGRNELGQRPVPTVPGMAEPEVVD